MPDRQMVFHINAVDGKVLLTFAEPITYMSFKPANARKFAEELVRLAEIIEVDPHTKTEHVPNAEDPTDTPL